MNTFDLKQKLDNSIYRLYNIFSDFLFLFKFKLKKELKKNFKYKNIHESEKCFILATGPSLSNLNSKQILALKDEKVFAVNSFYKVEHTRELTPDYYVLLDNLFWEEWSNVFGEIESQYNIKCPIFITDIRSKRFIKNLENLFLYSKKYPVSNIACELEKNMYIGMNVVVSTILCAIYMGFTEINLIGIDYNAFCSSGKGHAYDDEGEISQSNYNLAFYLKFYWITTEFHYLISRYAKNKGVKIFNLSADSLLDAYHKRDINESLN